MMTWGKKAGEWGKGVDGDKNKKDRRKEEGGRRNSLRFAILLVV
jgi:hypothetical protein